jgi:hypothetical protein
MMKLDDLSEELNEEEAIPIGAMDVPPLIATAGHMPDGSGTLQAERSRHEEGRRKNRIRVAGGQLRVGVWRMPRGYWSIKRGDRTEYFILRV